MQKQLHQPKSIFVSFRLFLGDSGGRNGLVVCGIRFLSKQDHYDFWSRLGGHPMIMCFVVASSQLPSPS
jgi:hypothetical protein